jgi:hypothetical protein
VLNDDGVEMIRHHSIDNRLRPVSGHSREVLSRRWQE